MELNIDPTLSVYHLTERVQKQSTTLNHRRTMNIISYEIENATLLDGARTRIFSSFQRMSRFIPQVERYTKLAKKAEMIYVFGIPDVEVPPIENVTYIPLTPDDQLAREWFIVSYGRDYATMLSTEEQSRFTDADSERVFRGLWTFQPTLTSIIAEWLSRVVNAAPFGFSEDDHNAAQQNKFIDSIKRRLDARLARQGENPAMQNTTDELRAIIGQSLPHNQMTNSVSSRHNAAGSKHTDKPHAMD
jgi:DICT domain-containing protein